MGRGDTKLEPVDEFDSDSVEPGGELSLGFEVDALSDCMEFQEVVGIEKKSPIQPNPHIKFVFIEDSDGYAVQFVEMDEEFMGE
ncbi:hypothetical protein [Halarsenatibacter silvermanii]|uniref:Lactoylglutathione lyase n=1 Tax=Halarsenatibacter silvermanii TaxID=321763 RepID=A0A1G9RJB9_9FIRM|nr:hypothetical protein [Halarsenatibacter silvermanii]SDM23402.1 lactoylglutathione lyase [Halarsenatibacter silvermanii]